ncbi:hypothetical protein A2716_03020 [candidate division WWE3 bacterium RIFCSPHIGHO2_01_FULL_40_23]|uniref:Transcription elongation factor GreA/GreB C-terminal domain-containing protein n=1 Tax=candidate division WWE3 bacterium RIFCSPLOWO2_01_FULL_41_18 TaxID=1802625 RepID=A0A1F4VC28_UNCKA|nr:MAG: hypothetical protein A2716_03020 [candidate division WWE3 bacterium RIFCSPHIGHO2_01_FULL_40_23]OGC54802.1 MAG: hypothetical protein A3A78_04975 [candidate division WWE3 bacterium RIFCSPLOWO2_01_FULL_41_18]
MENFVTDEGFKKLLDQKKKVKEELKNATSEMAESSEGGGGWHENNFFEFLEEKIHHLTARLFQINEEIKNAKVTESINKDQAKIGFGSTVELLINGETATYKILGEADSDLSKNIISYTSPIGQAIMGKSIGEETTARLPEIKVIIKILNIC